MVPLTAESTSFARFWSLFDCSLSEFPTFSFLFFSFDVFMLHFRFEWCTPFSFTSFFSVSLLLLCISFFLCHFTMYCIFSTNVSIIILTFLFNRFIFMQGGQIAVYVFFFHHFPIFPLLFMHVGAMVLIIEFFRTLCARDWVWSRCCVSLRLIRRGWWSVYVVLLCSLCPFFFFLCLFFCFAQSHPIASLYHPFSYQDGSNFAFNSKDPFFSFSTFLFFFSCSSCLSIAPLVNKENKLVGKRVHVMERRKGRDGGLWLVLLHYIRVCYVHVQVSIWMLFLIWNEEEHGATMIL